MVAERMFEAGNDFRGSWELGVGREAAAKVTPQMRTKRTVFDVSLRLQSAKLSSHELAAMESRGV